MLATSKTQFFYISHKILQFLQIGHVPSSTVSHPKVVDPHVSYPVECPSHTDIRSPNTNELSRNLLDIFHLWKKWEKYLHVGTFLQKYSFSIHSYLKHPMARNKHTPINSYVFLGGLKLNSIQLLFYKMFGTKIMAKVPTGRYFSSKIQFFNEKSSY